LGDHLAQCPNAPLPKYLTELADVDPELTRDWMAQLCEVAEEAEAAVDDYEPFHDDLTEEELDYARDRCFDLHNVASAVAHSFVLDTFCEHGLFGYSTDLQYIVARGWTWCDLEDVGGTHGYDDIMASVTGLRMSNY
jgi:hypothetical protein